MLMLFSLKERRRLAAAVEELEARGATQVIAIFTFNDHDDDQHEDKYDDQHDNQHEDQHDNQHEDQHED